MVEILSSFTISSILIFASSFASEFFRFAPSHQNSSASLFLSLPEKNHRLLSVCLSLSKVKTRTTRLSLPSSSRSQFLALPPDVALLPPMSQIYTTVTYTASFLHLISRLPTFTGRLSLPSPARIDVPHASDLSL